MDKIEPDVRWKRESIMFSVVIPYVPLYFIFINYYLLQQNLTIRDPRRQLL
jgi:hypothetical protein